MRYLKSDRHDAQPPHKGSFISTRLAFCSSHVRMYSRFQFYACATTTIRAISIVVVTSC
jgi:hypothetical protein